MHSRPAGENRLVATYVAPKGDFDRDTDYITTRITADGRDGYPVEPGRYRLVVARACPWANRAIIVRRLLGLEDVLSMGLCGPDPRRAQLDVRPRPGRRRPGARIPRLQEAYFTRFPDYPKGHHRAGDRRRRRPGRSSPTTSPQITLDFSTEWAGLPPARRARPVSRAAARRDRRGRPSAIYTEVNNGVYRCGFAGSPGGLRGGVRPAVRPRWTGSPSGWRTSATWWATPSPRPTSGCSPRWPASTRSTTATSSATGSKLDRDAGAVGVRARPVPDARASATPSTSSRSSSTTTSCTRDINPTRIVPEGAGPVRLADPARPGGAGRQAVRRRHPAGPDTSRPSGCRRGTRPARPRRCRTDHSACGQRELVTLLVAHQRRQLHRDAGQPAALRIDGGDGHGELGVGRKSSTTLSSEPS